jgi:hypothetical protein
MSCRRKNVEEVQGGKGALGTQRWMKKLGSFVEPYKSENIKGQKSNENNINWSQWFATFSNKKIRNVCVNLWKINK